MKKIINGKSYNTDTAKKVAEWSSNYGVSDFNYYEEALYRKRTGEYFIYGSGNAASKYAQPAYGEQNAFEPGEAIIPLTLDGAKKWCEQHLGTDKYEKIWGVPGEGDDFRDIHVQVTGLVAKKLNAKLRDSTTPLKDIVTKALDEYL